MYIYYGNVNWTLILLMDMFMDIHGSYEMISMHIHGFSELLNGYSWRFE